MTTSPLPSHWKWFQLFHLRSGIRDCQGSTPWARIDGARTTHQRSREEQKRGKKKDGARCFKSEVTHPMGGAEPRPLASMLRRCGSSTCTTLPSATTPAMAAATATSSSGSLAVAGGDSRRRRLLPAPAMAAPLLRSMKNTQTKQPLHHARSRASDRSYHSLALPSLPALVDRHLCASPLFMATLAAARGSTWDVTGSGPASTRDESESGGRFPSQRYPDFLRA